MKLKILSFVSMFIVVVSIIFLQSCVSPYTTNSISEQQFRVRHCVDSCIGFDCVVLNKEIDLLKQMIKDNDPNRVFQQSIVTAITRKCRKSLLSRECPCYNEEIKLLKKMY